jgi:hypothetical protein
MFTYVFNLACLFIIEFYIAAIQFYKLTTVSHTLLINPLPIIFGKLVHDAISFQWIFEYFYFSIESVLYLGPNYSISAADCTLLFEYALEILKWKCHVTHCAHHLTVILNYACAMGCCAIPARNWMTHHEVLPFCE